uniref:lysozyme n=1 Tax=Glossina austeni TaxID=7395 RepID=A0A1A9ULV5_GLOAU
MTKFVHSPVILCIEIVFILFSLTKTSSKTFERCEFANILRYYYNLDLDEVAQWVCIAQEASGLNSSLRSLDSHGLFQINEQSWCSPPGTGCNVECDKLRDDHITDDLACVKVIHAEHQRKSGDGYTAWPAYQRSCRNQSFAYIENCFGNQLTSQYRGNTTKNYSSKVYDRCELARELYEEHNIPIEEVATWICIAHHESQFNTSSVGRREGDGSIAYGLFQISDQRWCSYKRNELRGCNLHCSRLIDDNIADDVECIKHIYKEHDTLLGDGFTAWAVYLPYCRNQQNESVTQIDQCFDTNELKKYTTKTKSFKVNNITHKTYKYCELTHELYHKHHIAIEQIPIWICIVEHESRFNTAAVTRVNGSANHGIFQISDLYWCSHDHNGGKACNISCDDLLDSDISDDVRCVKTIYEEHTGISGDGFTAWVAYKPHCRNKNLEDINQCLSEDELKGTLNISTST